MEIVSHHLAMLVDSWQESSVDAKAGGWVFDMKQDVSLVLKHLLKNTY